MSEQKYNQDTFPLIFGEIKEQLDRIEKQTTKTNGNVISLKLWRAYITGAVVIISVIVLPLIVYINNTQVNQLQAKIKNDIHTHWWTRVWYRWYQTK